MLQTGSNFPLFHDEPFTQQIQKIENFEHFYRACSVIFKIEFLSM
jgi:hypothetical protein